MDLNDVLKYTQDYICDSSGNVKNLDDYPIKGETAEIVKIAYFVSHLSSQLYFEEVYGKENAPSYMSVSKEYTKKALQLLGFQNYGLEISKDNKELLEAILSGKGHVNLEIDNAHAALLRMFKLEERPFYSAYLNHMYKGSELNVQNFELNHNLDTSSNKIKVSIDNYLVSYDMDETEKKLKSSVMTVRNYMKNYELTQDGRLINLANNGAYEDKSLPNYKWAERVYEEAKFIRSESLKRGDNEESFDFYIEAILYSRMLKKQAQEEKKAKEQVQNANQVAGAPSPEQKTSRPKPVLKPTTEDQVPEPKNTHRDYEENSQVKKEDMPKSKPFMSYNEIVSYISNYHVKSGKVFSKNGQEITDQDLIDKVKTAIMFYCEARDLHKLLVDTYHQKDQGKLYYFDKVFEKYGANGEVNDYGTNKLINALLNCNGHLEEKYIPVFADKYAILKGGKKSYVESYLRLKFKEKGISLESLDVKFENVANNYIKATVDMKLVPLKDKNKSKDDNSKTTPKPEQSTPSNDFANNPSKADEELTIDELKAKINEAQLSLANLQELLKKLEEKEKQQNNTPTGKEADPPKQEPPENKQPPKQGSNPRKVEKRRKCTIIEKIKNAALIAGAIFLGENVTDRTPAYREINLQVGYLQYESAKKNIVVTTDHIKTLREKMSASKGLTEKERKKLEKKINKLAKKAKNIPATRIPQSQNNPPQKSEPQPEILAPPPHQEPSIPEENHNQTSTQSNIIPDNQNANSATQTPEELIKNNPLTFTDEEWNNMDLEQQKACAKIKLHEAKLTGDQKEINYWVGICDGLDFQTRLSSDQYKGR